MHHSSEDIIVPEMAAKWKKKRDLDRFLKDSPSNYIWSTVPFCEPLKTPVLEGSGFILGNVFEDSVKKQVKQGLKIYFLR